MTEIRTTHTGSLPRAEDLTRLLIDREDGEEVAELEERTVQAVKQVVQRQVEHGIDLLNDGEQGKASYATYVKYRLSGFEGESIQRTRGPDEFPDFTEQTRAVPIAGPFGAQFPSCVAPISPKDPDAVHQDIERLRAAAQAAGVGTERLFMSAASPGLIASYFRNQFYPDRESYLAAIIEAMRDEYRAIAESGIILQLDCPDFASTYSSRHQDMTVDEFRHELAESVEALNTAIEGLPTDRVRFHVCWGNTESPHNHDIELRQIADILVTAKPAGWVLEACNPRHGHEWRVFEDLKIPDEKYLVPGVIDTTTNFVEHPELVAQRLQRYIEIVGAGRVVAGTDCGFATWAGPRRVAPSVAWAKLDSLVAGARLASQNN